MRHTFLTFTAAIAISAGSLKAADPDPCRLAVDAIDARMAADAANFAAFQTSLAISRQTQAIEQAIRTAEMNAYRERSQAEQNRRMDTILNR
jgi:hypothetical protein